jgi:hypothetical protein
MRKRLWAIRVLPLFFVLVAPSALLADGTVYYFTQQIGDSSIVGTITTNGTMGNITLQDLDSFSFGVTQATSTGTGGAGGTEKEHGGTVTTVISGANFTDIKSTSFGVSQATSTATGAGGTAKEPGSTVTTVLSGQDFTATPSALLFNFSGKDDGYLAFEVVLPTGALEYLCWGNGAWPCSPADPQGIAMDNIAGDGVYSFVGESGTQVIASTTPAPEPTTTTLLLTGLFLLQIPAFRKRMRRCDTPVS